jgi:hypothetical protein
VAYGRLVEQAMEQFRARRYLEARSAFDRALPLAESDAERATLTFNAAVAAFEAGDFLDAEQRFVASAAYDPASAPLCEVYAGLAALGAGAPERAAARLARVSPNDAAAAGKRAELERALAEARKTQQLATFRAGLARGRRAYAARDLAKAREELQAVTGSAALATANERATLFLLLGRIAHAAHDHEAARRHYERAVKEEPEAADLQVALGDLAADRDAPASADRYYASAEGLTTDDALRELIDERRDLLYPLPGSGPLFSGELSGGYDSNAAQSGAANAVGATGTGARGSAFARLSLAFDYTLRAGRRTAIAPFYSAAALELLDPDAAELSLQSHELGVFLYWALGHRLVLRASPSAALFVVGQSEPDAFSFEPGLGLRLDAFHGATWATRLAVDGRRIQGLGGRDALTGQRFELSLRETATFGMAAAWAEAAIGHNGMGTSLQTTSAEDFELCSEILQRPRPECREGNLYRIPLGYRFGVGTLGASYRPVAALHLSASLKVEYRRYLDDSLLLIELDPSGPFGTQAEYRKRRVDLRTTLAARAAYELDERGRWSLVGNYALLVSSSNVAQGEGGREHALDYDDRNFSQHVVELGIAARF